MWVEETSLFFTVTEKKKGKEATAFLCKKTKTKGTFVTFCHRAVGFSLSFFKITWSCFRTSANTGKQQQLKFDHIIVMCACTSFMTCDGRAKNNLSV